MVDPRARPTASPTPVRPQAPLRRQRLQLHRPADPRDPARADQGGPRRVGHRDGLSHRHRVRALLHRRRDPDRALRRSRDAAHGDRARPRRVERDDRAVGRGADVRRAGARAHRRRHRRGGVQPARALAPGRLLSARASRHRARHLLDGDPRGRAVRVRDRRMDGPALRVAAGVPRRGAAGSRALGRRPADGARAAAPAPDGHAAPPAPCRSARPPPRCAARPPT